MNVCLGEALISETTDYGIQDNISEGESRKIVWT